MYFTPPLTFAKMVFNVFSKPPCKDCADRIPGCHSMCERYKVWKGDLEEKTLAKTEYERVKSQRRYGWRNNYGR